MSNGSTDRACDASLAGENTHQDAIIRFRHGDPGETHSPSDILEEVDPANLRESEVAQRVRQRIGELHPVCQVIELLDMPDELRWVLLQFLASLGRDCHIQFDEHEVHTDLFVAVLQAVVGPHDLARCERGRRAAIEAAALCHRDAVVVASNLIVERMRALGVHGVRIADVQRELRDFVRTAISPDPERQAAAVNQTLPDAPVTPEAVIPDGWCLDATGITSSNGIVIPAPVVISQRHVNLADDTESVRLAFLRGGRWHQHTAGRQVIASRRLIVDLAAIGLPVTSNNASALVQFLSDYEAANLETIPLRRVSPQMGWQGDSGQDGFLWGRTIITAESQPEEVNQEESAVEGDALDTISFFGADLGDEQLASGFHAHGQPADWYQAIAGLSDFPRAQLAIYAALTPPLLAILDSSNFVIDYAGQTSQGKTITLRGAASVWGNSDDRSPAAALWTWDSTAIWRERASAVLNGLPLILDDTKRAPRKEDISKTIYDVASGRARGRGSPLGMARSGTWTKVLISSGEAQAVSYSNDGGTRARAISLWGSPFGTASQETAETVNHVNSGIRRSYGHAGPRFVAYLVTHRDRWNWWRQRYNDLRSEYEQRAGGNTVAIRMVAHLAALRTTAILAHEALSLAWNNNDIIEQLWDEVMRGTEGADRAEAALHHALNWAVANEDKFCERRHASDGIPLGGWAGRWDQNWPGRQGRRAPIGFVKYKLREILEAAGCEHDAIIRSWHDRNWLYHNPNRIDWKTGVGGESTYLIAITAEQVARVLDGSDAGPGTATSGGGGVGVTGVDAMATPAIASDGNQMAAPPALPVLPPDTVVDPAGGRL